MKGPLAALALAATPLAASGQILDVNLKAFATYWDTDDFGDALGGQIGLEVVLVDWFSAEARTGYLRSEHYDLNIVPAELVGTFRASILGTIKPYAGAGVGRYFVSSSDVDTRDREAIFPIVGMNVSLPASKLSLFAEARYMIFSDSISRELINSDLDGLAFSAGISWSF